MTDPRVAQLEAEERYARERYDLYRAKAYGPRPTSPARMRDLARAAEIAAERLSAAKSRQDETS